MANSVLPLHWAVALASTCDLRCNSSSHMRLRFLFIKLHERRPGWTSGSVLLIIKLHCKSRHELVSLLPDSFAASMVAYVADPLPCIGRKALETTDGILMVPRHYSCNAIRTIQQQMHLAVFRIVTTIGARKVMPSSMSCVGDVNICEYPMEDCKRFTVGSNSVASHVHARTRK